MPDAINLLLNSDNDQYFKFKEMRRRKKGNNPIPAAELWAYSYTELAARDLSWMNLVSFIETQKKREGGEKK